MNSQSTTKQTLRGSIVFQEQDLVADIEQDRYITARLIEKGYLIRPFAQGLEARFTRSLAQFRSRRLIEISTVFALLILANSILVLLNGATANSLAVFAPSLVVAALGLGLAQTISKLSLTNSFYMLLAITLGASVMYPQPEVSLKSQWLAMQAIAMFVLCIRAQLSLLAVLGCVGVIVCLGSIDAPLTSVIHLVMTACAALCCWIGQEDEARRAFLGECIQSAGQTQRSVLTDNKHARQLVALDRVTGLANQSSFSRFLGHEWQRAFRARQSVSLILISFAQTVSELQRADQLSQVTTELQRYSRRPGDLVGRLSDQDFAVLLSNTDIGNSRKLAESLLGNLHKLQVENQPLQVYMGVASTLPMPSMTHEDLHAKAKEALVAARQQ